MDQEHAELRLQTVCLLILTTLTVAAALRWLRPIMIPFVLAILISYTLMPLVEIQIRRLRFPQWLAVLGAMLCGMVVIGAMGSIVTASVSQLAENVGIYEAQIERLAQRVEGALPLERFGFAPAAETPTAKTPATGTPATETPGAVAGEMVSSADLATSDTAVATADDPLPGEKQPDLSLLDPFAKISGQSIQRFLLATTNAVLNLFSQGFLVLIFVFFLLIGQKPTKAKAKGVLGEIKAGVTSYLSTKVLVSLLTGLLTGLVLTFLNVDYAVAFGFLAFILNFIPNIGSFVATILPLPIVVLTPGFPLVSAILAIALPGAIQFGVGNVLEPKLLGASLDLHPITILIALIFWGMLWGVAGMFLAVPITAVLKILFERLEHTRPIAHVLAGRLDKLKLD
ncbi:MAG: transport protein TqsA [Candidatus Sumerlaeota bacterium]|nr:transport protein TqsA [Candidatus Sumerlaeota bacterium]